MLFQNAPNGIIFSDKSLKIIKIKGIEIHHFGSVYVRFTRNWEHTLTQWSFVVINPFLGDVVIFEPLRGPYHATLIVFCSLFRHFRILKVPRI